MQVLYLCSDFKLPEERVTLNVLSAWGVILKRYS